MKNGLQLLVLAATYTLSAPSIAACQSTPRPLVVLEARANDLQLTNGPSDTSAEQPSSESVASSSDSAAPVSLSASAPGGYAGTEYTATRRVRPYVFVLATGTLIGINGDSDAGFTVGGGWEWLPDRLKFSLAPEVRWSYWIPGVQITQPCTCGTGYDRERFLRGGLVVARNSNTARLFPRLHPFVDVLYGTTTVHFKKGELSAYDAGIPGVSSSISGRVLTLGGGTDYKLGRHFNLRSELQFNRTNVTASNAPAVISQQISLGLSYRF